MSESSNTEVRLPLGSIDDPTSEQSDEDMPDHMEATSSIRRNLSNNRKFIAYTVKLPADQLAALQSIWLELKRAYGANSPDKSGMIQQAISDWLKRWDGPEKQELLKDLLEIRQDTRRRQYRK